MAKRFNLPQGSWLLAEELLEHGDPAFVDEFCRIHDPDRLGTFAKTWYSDRRPASRNLMSIYLSRPLATYRHEALVKRLLKLAEKNQDDEVMGWFLVAVDRSLRRVKAVRHRYDWTSRESWTEEYVHTPPDTSMPRQSNPYRFTDRQTGETIAAPTREKHDRLRLFSVATRAYLRRRVWRYFRHLGQQDPQRYIDAMKKAMVGYTDGDCADGLALLDNWGLVHVMFHHSEVLNSKSSGWRLADGRGLSELVPAPAFAGAWQVKAEPLLEILDQAQARPVRQWAIAILKKHHPSAISGLPIKTLLNWIESDDSELAALAMDTLKTSPDLSRITINQWLELIEAANPQVLDVVCELIANRVRPDTLSLEDVVRLGCARPVPVARLGLQWLESKSFVVPDDYRTLLRVTEAESIAVRPELVKLAIRKLREVAQTDSGWVMELLDSPHLDVREQGWQWLIGDETIAGDVEVWQRLLENPHDDVRLKLFEVLEQHTAKPADGCLVEVAKHTSRLDPKLIRMLWASVLLNIHRGGRQKPTVVTAITNRIESHPDEAVELLPILAVALRSVRSVEFRAGLTSIVGLAERRSELTALIEQHFPELSLV